MKIRGWVKTQQNNNGVQLKKTGHRFLLTFTSDTCLPRERPQLLYRLFQSRYSDLRTCPVPAGVKCFPFRSTCIILIRSEEHTSELQSRFDIVCRLLLEKKKVTIHVTTVLPPPISIYFLVAEL